jgi:hypothetical protein
MLRRCPGLPDQAPQKVVEAMCLGIASPKRKLRNWMSLWPSREGPELVASLPDRSSVQPNLGRHHFPDVLTFFNSFRHSVGMSVLFVLR